QPWDGLLYFESSPEAPSKAPISRRRPPRRMRPDPLAAALAPRSQGLLAISERPGSRLHAPRGPGGAPGGRSYGQKGVRITPVIRLLRRETLCRDRGSGVARNPR